MEYILFSHQPCLTILDYHSSHFHTIHRYSSRFRSLVGGGSSDPYAFAGATGSETKENSRAAIHQRCFHLLSSRPAILNGKTKRFNIATQLYPFNINTNLANRQRQDVLFSRTHRCWNLCESRRSLRYLFRSQCIYGTLSRRCRELLSIYLGFQKPRRSRVLCRSKLANMQEILSTRERRGCKYKHQCLQMKLATCIVQSKLTITFLFPFPSFHERSPAAVFQKPKNIPNVCFPHGWISTVS